MRVVLIFTLISWTVSCVLGHIMPVMRCNVTAYPLTTGCDPATSTRCEHSSGYCLCPRGQVWLPYNKRCAPRKGPGGLCIADQQCPPGLECVYFSCGKRQPFNLLLGRAIYALITINICIILSTLIICCWRCFCVPDVEPKPPRLVAKTLDESLKELEKPTTCCGSPEADFRPDPYRRFPSAPPSSPSRHDSNTTLATTEDISQQSASKSSDGDDASRDSKWYDSGPSGWSRTHSIKSNHTTVRITYTIEIATETERAYARYVEYEQIPCPPGFQDTDDEEVDEILEQSVEAVVEEIPETVPVPLDALMEVPPPAEVVIVPVTLEQQEAGPQEESTQF